MTAIRRIELVLNREGRSTAPRGYVPVVVGENDVDKDTEKFFVHVKLLRDPFIVKLFEMAAEEFGYEQEGIIRIPCNIEHFMKTVDEICGN